MSWKMTKEVRRARLADELPKINSFSQFAVLLIMADTCRGESRVASISMTELAKLSGLTRNAMWRAVSELAKYGYVRNLSRGNQFQASSYEILPKACCADATSTALEHVALTQQAPAQKHVASSEEHVASDEEHVAFQASARCADATYPENPEDNPDEQSRGGARNATPPAPNTALTADLVAAKENNGQPTVPWCHPPVPWCQTHPGGTGEDCRWCMTNRKYTEWWLDNTDDGLAHQREVAVRRAAASINSKGEARERQLIGGKTRSERIISTLGARPKPRPVASERVREITAADEDELP